MRWRLSRGDSAPASSRSLPFYIGDSLDLECQLLSQYSNRGFLILLVGFIFVLSQLHHHGMVCIAAGT